MFPVCASCPRVLRHLGYFSMPTGSVTWTYTTSCRAARDASPEDAGSGGQTGSGEESSAGGTRAGCRESTALQTLDDSCSC